MQSAHLKKISWERISIWPLGMGLCKTFVLILLLLLTKCIFRNNIEFLEIKLNSFQNILINEKYRINIDSEQLRGKLFPIISLAPFQHPVMQYYELNQSNKFNI